MDCHHINSLLSEYADGMLVEQTAAEVRQHLTRCSRCREAYESMLKIMDHMSHLEAIPEPPDFVARVNERMDRRFSLAGLWRRLFVPLRFKLPLEATALAAIALLIVRLWGIGGAPELYEVTIVAPPPEKRETPQPGMKEAKKNDQIDQPATVAAEKAVEAQPLDQVTDEDLRVTADRIEPKRPAQEVTLFNTGKSVTRRLTEKDSGVQEGKTELSQPSEEESLPQKGKIEPKQLADKETLVSGGRSKPLPPIDLSSGSRLPETTKLQALPPDSLEKPKDLNTIIQALGAKLISREEVEGPGGPVSLVIEIQAGKYLELIRELGRLGEIRKSTSPIPENKLGSIQVKIVFLKSGS